MIQSEPQLRQALERTEGLFRAIDGLRAEIFPLNPRNFAILAEGPLEQIRQLQAQIDEYVQRLEEAPA